MEKVIPKDRCLADTHRVENQPPTLENYNAYACDLALQEAVTREGAQSEEHDLLSFGEMTGSAEFIELGFQANENKPVLHTHDRYGHRGDEIPLHPAYHRLMKASHQHGLHSSHWTKPGAGAHIARAARFYLMTQVEASHLCPITMTSAVIPALRHQPDLFDAFSAKIMKADYDPRNVPIHKKASMGVGMAMTEKQGGAQLSRTTLAF